MRAPLCSLFAALALAVPATAQFGDAWLTYTDETGARLPGGPLSVSAPDTEVDMAWGDLDQDGFTDLVVVRKEPFSTLGGRTNLLLMNEGGVLVDRSAQLATDADVAGDQGFLTATNDRDVALADVDGDGWLDVVTATTLGFSTPKVVGHPRVYRNLGEDGAGTWLGLRYEESRIPRLHSYISGFPSNPNFTSVSVADVDGDGFVDLYFADQDSIGEGLPTPLPVQDVNDRLLINDGNGYFTDQSVLRMTSEMLESFFGTSAVLADLNGDGLVDVLKNSALSAPSFVSASYQDPSNPGTFHVFDAFHFNDPYHVNAGDLNGDGRLDVVVTDDFDDTMRINTGTDVFGRVIWSPSRLFDFLAGGDDTLGSNSLIVDLDGDGWNEVLVCDVDVHTPGYDRRLHVYHNRTTVVGTTEVLLREEREDATEAGWIGAPGLYVDDLRATHDVAVFDLENDGDLDLVVARKDGALVFTAGPAAPSCGLAAYGEAAGGANVLTMTGAGSPQPGAAIALTTTGFQGAVGVHAVSPGEAAAPLLGGTLLVDANSLYTPLVVLPVQAGQTTWNLALPPNPALVGAVGYAQAAGLDGLMPAGWALSNGVRITVCP